jgi:ABC-2 type transport system ATP-binding protein
VGIQGAASAAVRSAIESVSGVERVEVLTSGDQSFLGRAYAGKGRRATDIAREIATLATSKQWILEELHQEEGKLDEVFRAITRTEG